MMKHENSASETPEKHKTLEEKSGHEQEMVGLYKVWLAEAHGHNIGKVTGMCFLKTKDVWKKEILGQSRRGSLKDPCEIHSRK